MATGDQSVPCCLWRERGKVPGDLKWEEKEGRRRLTCPDIYSHPLASAAAQLHTCVPPRRPHIFIVIGHKHGQEVIHVSEGIDEQQVFHPEGVHARARAQLLNPRIVALEQSTDLLEDKGDGIPEGASWLPPACLLGGKMGGNLLMHPLILLHHPAWNARRQG